MLLDIVCEKLNFLLIAKILIIIFFHLIKDYVEMKYSCFSNKRKESEIAKIVFKENFPITRTKDLRCTQQQCSSINYTYTVYFDNWSGSDHYMIVEYLKKNSRKIFSKGNLINKYYLFKIELTFNEF